MLRIYNFVNDVTFFLSWALWWSDTTAAASLQCRVRSNIPAAWHWLSPVLDNCGRQD